MTKTSESQQTLLRSTAEHLVDQLEESGDTNAGRDKLLQELRDYQSELEIQNQQLRESRAQLEQALERANCLYHQSPVGYVTIDVKGQIQDLNESFATMINYPTSRLRLAYLADFCTEETASILRQRLPAFYKKPIGKILDVAFNTSDGGVVMVEIQGRLLPGEPLLACNVIDRTQRKQAEEAHKDNDAKLRAITSAARNAILMVNSSGLVTYGNPACERVLGYSPNELLGQHLHELLAPEHYLPDYRRNFEQFRRDGKGSAINKTIELTARHKSGRILDIELSLSAVAIKGEWHGVGIIRDITNAKMTALELVRQQQEIENTRQLLAREKFGRDTLMDIVQDGIAIINQNHQLIEFNQSFADMLGYTSEEMKNLHTWDWEATISEEEIRANFADPGSLKARFESRHRRKDGTDYAVEVSASGSEINGEKIVVCISRDITERKLAEAALQQEKQFSEEILKALPGVFYMFDKTGTFIRWNEHFKYVTGYSDEELVQRQGPDFFLGEDRLRIDKAIKRVFIDGEANIEANLCNRNGVATPYQLSGIRVLIGAESYLLGVGLDVSTQKKVEEDLRQRTEELEIFNYTVSHDLKSPLVTVKTFLGFLEQDMRTGDTEAIKQDLHHIRTATDRMGLLLDDLLKLSRSSWVANQIEQISLKGLLENTLTLVQGQIENAGARITLPDTDMILHADPSRLLEIWQNLIDNALTHGVTKENPCIDIGFESGAEPVFYVRDFGPGIAREFHEKIFGLFEKLDRSSKGSGLGLALVKRIVEKHGGTIWIETGGNGPGCCFKFTLPAALHVSATDQRGGK